MSPQPSTSCFIGTGLLQKNRRNAHAFSLVEVVLAMGIFSFAMATLVTLIPTGLKSYQTAYNSTAAAEIMQNVVTDVQLKGITSIANGTMIPYYFDSQGSFATASTQIYTAYANFSAVGSGNSTPANSLDGLSTTAGKRMTVDVVAISQPQATNRFSAILAY